MQSAEEEKTSEVLPSLVVNLIYYSVNLQVNMVQQQHELRWSLTILQLDLRPAPQERIHVWYYELNQNSRMGKP